ncbi:MAG: hypothetical protein P8Y28_11340 [Gammaproteobacteria bacterium]
MLPADLPGSVTDTLAMGAADTNADNTLKPLIARINIDYFEIDIFKYPPIEIERQFN